MLKENREIQKTGRNICIFFADGKGNQAQKADKIFMEYKQEQAQLQRRTPQKLNTESAAYVKRNIITPAMQDLAERLAQLYNDILDAVELPDYNRRELNSLLNLQGAINPIYEQLKDIIIY